MSVLDSKSKLTLSLCLIWETERPFENKPCRSPIFTLKNQEWYLILKAVIGQYNDTYFNLYMDTTKEQAVFPTFMAKTYYINQYQAVFFCQRKRISGKDEFISRVKISDVIDRIDHFNFHGNLAIVCVFDDADTSSELCGSEVVLGQRSLHFPLKKESQSSSSSSTSRDPTLSLEKLSEDLEILLDSEVLPDVQLIVEETSIPCHRAVLAARSKVFAAMFQHEMTESTTGVLEIKDIELSVIKVFLKYLYSGKIPDDLTEEDLVNLYKAGGKYGVDDLKKLSSSQMRKFIEEENYLIYLTLAEVSGDQEFKDAVIDYIVKDDILVKSQDWIDFSCENLALANEVYRKYVNK